jgi:putative SOS response-associated peptidase YedK
MPATSRKRSGVASIVSNTFSPKARHGVGTIRLVDTYR